MSLTSAAPEQMLGEHAESWARANTNPESASVNQTTRNIGRILAPCRVVLGACLARACTAVAHCIANAVVRGFPGASDRRSAQNRGATQRAHPITEFSPKREVSAGPRLIWMVWLQWPWLRERSKIISLTVMIGSGNESVSEQIGDLLGVAPRAKSLVANECRNLCVPYQPAKPQRR